jgi:putative ABC transport system permease protein
MATHRPVRAMLTGLGTILGVFAFVVALGLTATASAQISERFTVLSSTEVLVEDVGPEALLFGPSFPADAQARIQRLPGTVSAGLFWRLPHQTVGAAPDYLTQRRTEDLPILAASAGALAAMHPTMLVGRLYDQFHEARAHRVAVLGFTAAKRLGIARVDDQQAIFIDGVALTVIGIIADVQRRPDDVLLSVILPPATATAVVGPPAAQTVRMLVETRVGAAKQVSTQVALALRPDRPEDFRVIGPPDPTTLREGVSADLRVLLLALTAVGLVIGAVGIMNTTLVAVRSAFPRLGLGARSGLGRVTSPYRCWSSAA